VAKVFSTHPMTADRIKAVQKNINEILPTKPEYVVNTSEFNEMRGRIVAAHQRRKHDDADSNKPTLHQAPGSHRPIEDRQQQPEGDDRPTLKRQLAGEEL
jgi:predicted Zn-dependent protease